MTKLNEITIETICKYIEEGATIRTACAAAGIGKSTYYRWIKAAENETDGLYRDFWDRTSESLAKARITTENAVFSAALGGEVYETRVEKKPDGSEQLVFICRQIPPDGYLCLKILERRYPDDWGMKIKKNFDFGKSVPGSKDGQPVQIDLYERFRSTNSAV